MNDRFLPLEVSFCVSEMSVVTLCVLSYSIKMIFEKKVPSTSQRFGWSSELLCLVICYYYNLTMYTVCSHTASYRI